MRLFSSRPSGRSASTRLAAFVCSALGILSLGSQTAMAVPVAIVNPDFDFFTVGNGTFVNAVAGSKDPANSYTSGVSGPGNGFVQTFNNFTPNGDATFPGWTCTASAGGVSGSGFYTPPKDACAGIPSGSLGTQSILQKITGALDPNTEYTMTADMFARLDPFAPEEGITFQIRTGAGVSLGGVLTFVAPTQLAGGSGANLAGSLKLVVTTGGSILPTSDMQIFIENHTPASGKGDATLYLDNLAIESARVVPEPACLSLFAFAGLFMCRRRAR